MRLISLATELGAEFSEVSNTFNAEILIKPNSKIALSSIVAELNIEDVDELTAYDPYYIELMDLDVDSYYGRQVASNGFNGQRRNFIASIPKDQVKLVMPWQPNGFSVSGIAFENLDPVSTTFLDTTGTTSNIAAAAAVYPASFQYRLRWTPAYPVFLDLKNKEEFNIRQLSIRLINYDGTIVALSGPMYVDVLIKDGSDM